MKVSEAKTKVCPFMSDNTTGKDIEGKYNAVSYCICGDCMAWEYTKTQEETEVIALFISFDTQEDRSALTDRHIKVSECIYGEYREYKDTRYAIMEELKEDDKEGYCERLVR